MSIAVGGRQINLSEIGKRAFIKNLGAVIGSRLYVELKGIVEHFVASKVGQHGELANWLINVIVNEIIDELIKPRSPAIIRFKDAVLDGALGAMYFDILSAKAPSLVEYFATMGLSEEVPQLPQASVMSTVASGSSSSGSEQLVEATASARRVW